MSNYPPVSSFAHLARVMDDFRVVEESIVPHLPLFLFTWTPCPKKLPFKYDMVKNYKYHIKFFFSQWQRPMHRFAIVPEFNLNGNIHYHGWFQLCDTAKWYKSVLPQMKRSGYVKVNKSQAYRVNSYEQEGNSLYYYKKEVASNSMVFQGNVPYTHFCLPSKPDRRMAREKYVSSRREIFNSLADEPEISDEEIARENMKIFLKI